MIAIFVFWLICAGIVAAAADARGRNGAGWFFLAILISPLLALILVLVSPNLKLAPRINFEQERYRAGPPPLPPPLPGSRSDRVYIDRSPRPFEPDGVYAGIPYKVEDDGSIHAIMQGAMVKFSDFDRFTAVLGTSTG